MQLPRLLSLLSLLFILLFTSNATFALTAGSTVSTQENSLPVTQIQNPTLIVGSEQDFPPFATGMTDETAGGFTVELWKEVAAEADLNYTIRVLPFHQILQEYKAGKIDVLINLAQSEKRKKFTGFTVPHVVVHGAIFVRKGESSIRSERDLTGKSIIVLNADLAHDYAVSKGWKQQLVPVSTAEKGLRLLSSGSHDVMLLSKLTGMQTLQATGLTNIKALKAKAGYSQKFSFAVHKDRPELLAKINESLAITKANGLYDTRYEKWFAVYDEKEIGLRDLLKYIIPVVLIFTSILAYSFYRHRAERKQAELKLIENEERWKFALEGTKDGVWDWNIETGEVFFSSGLKAMMGYDDADIAPDIKEWVKRIHPDDKKISWSTLNKHFNHEEDHYMSEHRLLCKDGTYKWILDRGKVVTWTKHNKPLRMIGTHIDLSERKAAERSLKKSEVRYRRLVEQIQDDYFIYSHDIDGVFQYVSPSVQNILGYKTEEFLCHFGTYLTDSPINDEAKRQTAVCISGEHQAAYEVEIYHKDRHTRILKLLETPTLNSAGQVIAVEGIAHDITKQRKAEEEIRHLAMTDPLTGLANRTKFQQRLTQSIKLANRENKTLALMMVDLDKFKPVNDTYGHPAGDALLQAVASIFTKLTRESDVIARIGGDEFAILVVHPENKDNVGATAQRIIDEVKKTITIMGNEIQIGASIGIALYPKDDAEEEALFKKADLALYKSKNQGRGIFTHYHPNFNVQGDSDTNI